MLTREQAVRVALEKVEVPDPAWPDRPSCAIVAEATIERPWGWVFFWTIPDAGLIAGNAPVIVSRKSGEAVVTGTAYPIEHYLAEYEHTLRSGAPPEVVCVECGSSYLDGFSYMADLCPECSSILYGYPPCEHEFVEGRCRLCFWDGSTTAYIQSLNERG